MGCAALDVAHATSGIAANVLTLLCPAAFRAQPAQSLPTTCAGQRGGTIAIRCRSECQAPQRQRPAVNKLNVRIIQRTAKAKKASPLPLPRSRSRPGHPQLLRQLLDIITGS